jgi:hypothetical protein
LLRIVVIVIIIIIIIMLLLWFCSTLLGPGRFSSFSILYIVDRTPWTWNQHIADYYKLFTENPVKPCTALAVWRAFNAMNHGLVIAIGVGNAV